MKKQTESTFLRIEMILKRLGDYALRLILNDWNISYDDALAILGWKSLAHRRKCLKLIQFYISFTIIYMIMTLVVLNVLLTRIGALANGLIACTA